MITGNSYIDVVLSYKTVEAERKGIDIICKHNNVSNLKLTGVDISVLLGNALDNAIEASQKLVDNKIISVIIANKNNYIWITVINNVEENVDVDNMITRKIQKEYHGIGIVTMKAIVEKYDGEIYFECENKQFKTIIIFPIGDE